ncbi:hypothetical protein CMO83_04200 [Candidatus Woesearchaeota archaeon]|jgi:hypothetical protein|nr:hypothetical protein [Candidatus Woesearchaeota archaeon]|tara:strand:- start:6333 stop:6593 length:261 start_codon:yes stop_codon:yes gene_type:complete
MSINQERITGFLIQLMILAENRKHNLKELELIDTLDYLLTQSQEGLSLDQERLGRVRHKVSRVSCFSERYMEMVYFLQDYQHEQSS